jgi:hypothetical protein
MFSMKIPDLLINYQLETYITVVPHIPVITKIFIEQNIIVGLLVLKLVRSDDVI